MLVERLSFIINWNPRPTHLLHGLFPYSFISHFFFQSNLWHFSLFFFFFYSSWVGRARSYGHIFTLLPNQLDNSDYCTPDRIIRALQIRKQKRKKSTAQKANRKIWKMKKVDNEQKFLIKLGPDFVCSFRLHAANNNDAGVRRSSNVPIFPWHWKSAEEAKKLYKYHCHFTDIQIKWAS